MIRIRSFITVAALSIDTLFVLCMVFAAYGGCIDPQRTTIPAIAALTFPILLIANMIIMIIGLFWNWRISMINLIGLIVCWDPAIQFCPLHPFSPKIAEEEKAREITIMTYNALYLRDFAAGEIIPPTPNPTVANILGSGADIVALQECGNIGNLNDKEQQDSLERIYPHRLSHIDGLAVLSRFPFREVTLDYTPEPSFDVQAYEFEIGGSRFTLFNLHLQSIGLSDSDKELYRNLTKGETGRDEIKEIRQDLIGKLSAAFRKRAVQAREVRALVERTEGSVILCGDFNDIPGCYAQRTIMGDNLKDAYQAEGFGPAITYHANRFYFRIDHILYTPTLKPIEIHRPKYPHSDHYPLVATFILPKPAETPENP